MRQLAGALLALVALVAGGLGYIYSGLYDVSARSGHSAPVTWLLDTALHRSVERRAADIEVPPLDDPDTIARGAHAYDEMCAVCHLKPGQTPTLLHEGLMPRPPVFAEGGSHMKPAENFWIIKHGIKMTGMPSWGESHSDEEIWALVAVIERMHQLSAEEFERLSRTGGTVAPHTH